VTDIRLNVHPEVAAALGKSPEEMADMTCMEFAELCWERGFELKVSANPTPDGGAGKLTITYERQQPAAQR
jgi:hypothetical protein